MTRMTGKQALAEMLLAEGVEYIFGNPGTSESPLMDVLQDYPQLKYILAIQEGTAVGMADGYARATGRPSFANIHIAGGLANGISMLYDSFRGETPLILTAGQSDTRAFITEPTLSGNLVEMTRQYTKWSTEIHHASDVPVAIRRAFKEAKTPPAGPVFISLPWNSLDEEADVDIIPSSQAYSRVRPDVEALVKASRLLAQADSPIMLVGDRVARSGAVKEAVEVAETLGARVLAVTFSEVNFPTSHPQYMGSLNLNSPVTAQRLADADVLLAVGTNIFSQFLYVPEPLIGPNTKLIHLDNNPTEVEKIYPTQIAMLADPKAGLQELADALQDDMSGTAKEAAKIRAASLAQQKEKAKEGFQKRVKHVWDNEPIAVERMMTEIAQALPSNAIIADESITSRPALVGAMDFDEPGSLFTLHGGALGWGMPGALGIKLAKPDRPVVAVVGDGASMYTVQALWTAARHNIPVTYVICNNGTYRILKLNMDIYLKRMLKDTERQSQYIGMDFGMRLELAKMAEAMGVHGQRVEKPSELRPALEKALGLDKPALVDVVIDGSL